MTYTDKEGMRDLRRVIGAIESAGRNIDEDVAQAARRLERLSALSLIELVVRVQRSGLPLGLRPERPANVVHFE